MTKVENWKHRKKLCDIIPTPYPCKLNYRPLVDFVLGSSSLFLSIVTWRILMPLLLEIKNGTFNVVVFNEDVLF